MIEADSACAVWVPDPRSAQLIASATTLLNASKVSPFIRGLGVRHLAIYVDPHGQVAYADPKNEKKAPFALYGMPISYLIDRAGRIAGYLPSWMPLHSAFTTTDGRVSKKSQPNCSTITSGYPAALLEPRPKLAA